jgi:hypothetical protein
MELADEPASHGGCGCVIGHVESDTLILQTHFRRGSGADTGSFLTGMRWNRCFCDVRVAKHAQAVFDGLRCPIYLALRAVVVPFVEVLEFKHH